MAQTPSIYINAPVSGTQYWASMENGVIWNSSDSGTNLEVHVKAWSGANGTGSLHTVTTLDAWVWDQTQNVAHGHFQGSSVNSVAAAVSGATNGDWLKCSAKYTGSGVGSLEVFITYSASAPFEPTTPTFLPSAGGVGTSVTLTGTHFTDASICKLDGVDASFSVDSDTQITATVPSGALTGVWTVGNLNGSVDSATDFLVAVAYIYRSGVWTAGQIEVERSSSETAAQGVFVYRSGVWTAAG